MKLAKAGSEIVKIDFETLSAWLSQNLDPTNSITPHQNDIPKIRAKGIYFWLMDIDGYKALSDFVSIQPISPRYSKVIDGVKYDLVYLGTTGTGKKGNSTLSDRLRWHIQQKHEKGTICHGTLSTLRAGLGGLLSDDLIVEATESLVNHFMKQYLKVYWMEYPDNNSLIDDDERKLISALKPLLNLKNNPNAKADAPANSTQVYKVRRAVVYDSTRARMGCRGEDDKKVIKSNPTDDKPLFSHQVLHESDEGCMEYFVLQGQHIGEVTRGIPGLPLGKSKISIFESVFPHREFTNWRRVTGNNNNHNAQNIYTYFNNISSEGPPRYQVISDWMIDNNIKEITVIVCPIN